jgi:hypothetical protein
MPYLDGKPTTDEIRILVTRVTVTGGSLDRLVFQIDDWIDEAYQRGKDAGEEHERELRDLDRETGRSPSGFDS